MAKVNFQLYLEPKQHDFLKQKSDKTGKSMALIMREALDLYRQKGDNNGN